MLPDHFASLSIQSSLSYDRGDEKRTFPLIRGIENNQAVITFSLLVK